jgi:hypothetical protein
MQSSAVASTLSCANGKQTVNRAKCCCHVVRMKPAKLQGRCWS